MLQFLSLFNSSYFLLENDEDNAGKNTVLSATPKTPAETPSIDLQSITRTRSLAEEMRQK